MTVYNEHRFPHLHRFNKLKGLNIFDGTDESEKYNQQYNKELIKEWEEILSDSVDRGMFGGNDGIHKLSEYGYCKQR